MSRLSIEDRLSLFEPDIDYQPEAQEQSGEYVSFPDVKLANAITIEEVEDVLQMGGLAQCKAHKNWVEFCEEKSIVHLTTTTNRCDCPYDCLSEFVNTWSLPESEHLKMKDVLHLAWTAVKESNAHLSQRHGTFPELEIKELDSLQPYLDLRCKADNIKRKITELWKGSPIYLDDKETFRYDCTICAYKCKNHQWGLLPTALFLSVLDSIQRRYSAAIYCIVYDHFPELPRIGLYQHFRIVENYVLTSLRTYGNQAYKLLGSWYGLVVASIIRREDDVGCNELYVAIRDGLTEALGDITRDELFRCMSRIPQTRDDLDRAVELSGLAKAFGHPIIDLRAGLNVVREHACGYKTPNLDIGDIIACEFKSMFCCGWFKEHGSWPPVAVNAGCNPELRKAITNNYWPQAYQMRAIAKGDFACVDILQCLTFDFHPDLYDILVDKSCAPPLSQWTTAYDKCGFKLHHNQTPPRFATQPNRRVVMSYLQADEQAAYRKIEQVNSGAEEEDDLLILLCPKEGELKIESRLFSILTFNTRLFIGLTGHNLANHVLKYLKSQTMTSNELENLKRAFSFASESADGSLIATVLYFVLDFKKFNCQFRLALLLQLCKIIDQLYGFGNVFQELHRFFSNAYVMTNSRTRPPRIGIDGRPEFGNYCHTDNEGGFEGVAQKLWTLAIQLLLLHFMRQLGIRRSLTGQGDNQIIVARLSHEQRLNVRAFAKNVLNQLEVQATKWQIPTKKMECWYSKQLFENNKELYFRSVHVSNGLKFATKISSDSNDSLGSFETRIASVATTCEAVGRKIVSSSVPAVLQATEVIIASHQNGFLGKDVRSYRAVPLWHSVVGGLPISFLMKFSFRGFPDPLTSQLSLLKYLASNNQDLFNEIIQLSPMQPAVSLSAELLLLNPHALRLEDSLSQVSIIRDEVHAMIQKYTSNQRIAAYFTVDAKSKAQTLGEQLLTMRPYVSKLASEIYRTSDAGIALQVIGLLDNTRTMVRLTQTTGSVDLVEKVRSGEEAYLRTISWRGGLGRLHIPVKRAPDRQRKDWKENGDNRIATTKYT